MQPPCRTRPVKWPRTERRFELVRRLRRHDHESTASINERFCHILCASRGSEAQSAFARTRCSDWYERGGTADPRPRYPTLEARGGPGRRLFSSARASWLYGSGWKSGGNGISHIESASCRTTLQVPGPGQHEHQ